MYANLKKLNKIYNNGKLQTIIELFVKQFCNFYEKCDFKTIFYLFTL